MGLDIPASLMAGYRDRPSGPGVFGAGVLGHRPQFTLGERYVLRHIPLFRMLLGHRLLDRLQDQRARLMTLPHPSRRPWRRNMNMPECLVNVVLDGSALSTRRWR